MKDIFAPWRDLLLVLKLPLLAQLVAAVISAAVKNDGDRGWTSFVLLIVELNIIVWVSIWLQPFPSRDGASQITNPTVADLW